MCPALFWLEAKTRARLRPLRSVGTAADGGTAAPPLLRFGGGVVRTNYDVNFDKFSKDLFSRRNGSPSSNRGIATIKTSQSRMAIGSFAVCSYQDPPGIP